MRLGFAFPLVKLLGSISDSSQPKATNLNLQGLQGPVITILHCMSSFPGWLAPFEGEAMKAFGVKPSEAGGWRTFTLVEAFTLGLESGAFWDPFWLSLPRGRIFAQLVDGLLGEGGFKVANEPRMERICHIMGECVSIDVPTC